MEGDGRSKQRRWRYNSPLAQIGVLGLVCFCCPGMFSALNGLGGFGKDNAYITDNANTALSVTFATCSLVAGGVFNVVGHRLTLFIGGLSYVLYIGSYIAYEAAFVITAGALLGVGAGFLWAAQGAMVISYPDENQKGRYIAMFWSILNLGGALGSLITLIIEWKKGQSSVSLETYIAIMVIMTMGAVLSLALLPPTRVIRSGGEQVSIHKYSSWTAEVWEIGKLFADWRMSMLAPMFLASNWFYTYQFNCLNGGGLFTVRTRAFNGTLYWVAQILGANLMGNFLDSQEVWKSRKTRAKMGLAIVLVISTAIWGGGYAFQTTFSRQSVALKPESAKIDILQTHRFLGPGLLYSFYGLFDAVWQTYCYWIMGALTNDTRKAARFSGFYKAVQNVGAALANQVDARGVSFMNELITNWALLSFGCISAGFVAFYAVKDSNELLDSKVGRQDSDSLKSYAPPAHAQVPHDMSKQFEPPAHAQVPHDMSKQFEPPKLDQQQD